MTDWNKRNCKMVLSERDHRVETKLKIVICLPTEHLKVHKNSSVETCRCVPDRIGIWKCWILRRGENWNTQGTASRSKREKKRQTQPTYMALTDLNPGHIVGRRVLSPLRNFYNYNLQFTNINYNYKKIPVWKETTELRKKTY